MPRQQHHEQLGSAATPRAAPRRAAPSRSCTLTAAPRDTGFRASLDPWAKSQGITIKYNSSDQFDKLIQTRVQGGDLPNIAVFPQPGIIKGFVAKNAVQPLDDIVDIAKVKSSMVTGFLTPPRSTGRSTASRSRPRQVLYWYDKANFAAAGLTVPKTQDELYALMDKVKATGQDAAVLRHGVWRATGWPATDWIEDYVLQTAGIEVYDQWVAGTVKFSDAKLAPAFDIYQKMLMDDKNVFGGAKAAAANAFGTALNPMFAAANPSCFHRQAGQLHHRRGLLQQGRGHRGEYRHQGRRLQTRPLAASRRCSRRR